MKVASQIVVAAGQALQVARQELPGRHSPDREGALPTLHEAAAKL
jgi:hypothetical protein